MKCLFLLMVGVVLVGILLVLLFIVGCAPMICVCPPEDVIVHGDVDGGTTILMIPKAIFDNPNRFWTVPEFEQDLKKMYEDLYDGEAT